MPLIAVQQLAPQYALVQHQSALHKLMLVWQILHAPVLKPVSLSVLVVMLHVLHLVLDQTHLVVQYCRVCPPVALLMKLK